MKKTYIKLIFRGIRSTLNRFLSILAIVALGTGFLGGLLSVTPDMKLTTDGYFDDLAVYDINIKGTFGLTEDDIAAIAALDGVSSVMPAYVIDAVLQEQDTESYVTRVFGMDFDLPEDESLNRFKITDGRMPEVENECVIVAYNSYLDSLELGDTFTITEENDLSDTFTQTDFVVVGIAQSPLFISIEDEISTVGSGYVDLAMFVSAGCFDLDVYTDIYVTVEGAKDLDTFSDEYSRLVGDVYDYLEEFGLERSAVRYNEIVSEATEELDAAKADYFEAENEAVDKLNEARGEIDDAIAALHSAEAEILDAEAELEDGRSQLASNWPSYYSAIAQLDAAKEQLETVRGDVEAAKGAQSAGIPLDDEVLAMINQYDEGVASAAATEQYLAGVHSQLVQAERELEQAQADLDKGKEDVQAGWLEIEEAEAEYLAEREKAMSELADAWSGIESAEEEISAIEMPEWYVYDREDNVGFKSYKTNVEKVAAIAKVFPVFFFLVATLVALTTMTRMVEEQRTQIGTLKALGYTNSAILCNYMIYGVFASLLGCAAGLVPGFKLLPAVISNAYKMLYTLPVTLTPFRWDIALISSALIIAGITIASYSACRAALRNNPAQLLVASAPKPGKRILLERITPVWKRIPFTYKVTARNLFRYKKRFLMTIIGVAGCTALLVAGFGLKDSISDIVGKQFGEIYRYDLSVKLSDEDPDEWDETLSGILSDRESIGSYMQFHSESATVIYKDESHTATLYVPKRTGELKEFIVLRDLKSGLDVPFDDNSAVITEKLAESLGLSVGDSLELALHSGETSVLTITGVTENYIAGNLYLSPELYKENFLSYPEYNQALLITAEASASTDELSSRLLKSEQVEYIISVESLMDSFENSLGSIDYIVLVIIICSGALAIIVLYNLTNINICERKKELATVKVLGFYDKELHAYIFREINILSVIGTLIGLLLGIWLHSYIVDTVEVDAVMFGRNIYPLSFVFSAAITVGFTLLVNLLMRKQLHDLDMVESMKADE